MHKWEPSLCFMEDKRSISMLSLTFHLVSDRPPSFKKMFIVVGSGMNALVYVGVRDNFQDLALSCYHVNSRDWTQAWPPAPLSTEASQ